MGIFSRIMDKLRGHSGSGNTQAGQQGDTAAPPGQQAQYAPPQGQQKSAPQAQPQMQQVDVQAVMTDLARKKGGGGNWQTSIVDLLKMLDLDSSLDARKELAQELGVNAGPHGSAEQNIALHKAVMREIAKNGGKVPDSLRD
jgi:hypothetical protein